jgi:hypothetical protein
LCFGIYKTTKLFNPRLNKRWVAKHQEDGKIRDGWLSNRKMSKEEIGGQATGRWQNKRWIAQQEMGS